jgi:hypothetical protein
VFFHEATLAGSVTTFHQLWSFDFQSLPITDNLPYFAGLLGICTGLILLECIPALRPVKLRWITSDRTGLQWSRFGWMLLLYWLSYSYVVSGSYNPFIYFNF